MKKLSKSQALLEITGKESIIQLISDEDRNFTIELSNLEDFVNDSKLSSFEIISLSKEISKLTSDISEEYIESDIDNNSSNIMDEASSIQDSLSKSFERIQKLEETLSYLDRFLTEKVDEGILDLTDYI